MTNEVHCGNHRILFFGSFFFICCLSPPTLCTWKFHSAWEFFNIINATYLPAIKVFKVWWLCSVVKPNHKKHSGLEASHHSDVCKQTARGSSENQIYDDDVLMELCGLILSELPVLFSASQSDQLDGFSGKQKENVPPFTLDMVRTKVLLHDTQCHNAFCSLVWFKWS